MKNTQATVIKGNVSREYLPGVQESLQYIFRGPKTLTCLRNADSGYARNVQASRSKSQGFGGKRKGKTPRDEVQIGWRVAYYGEPIFM